MECTLAALPREADFFSVECAAGSGDGGLSGERFRRSHGGRRREAWSHWRGHAAESGNRGESGGWPDRRPRPSLAQDRPWAHSMGVSGGFDPCFRAVVSRCPASRRGAPASRTVVPEPPEGPPAGGWRLPANAPFRRRQIVPDDGILGPSPVEVLARRGFSGRSGRMSSRVKAPQTFRKHLSNAGLMCPADRVASVSTGARSRASGGAGCGIGAQASASRSPESSGREGKLSFASAREAGYPRASLPGAVPEGSRRRPARQQRRFT